MKGLLLKDFRLIMQQSRLFVIIPFMIASFMIFQGAESAPFIIAYTSMMGGILVLNTISYDEFGHSITFLMTLPITRKEYVQEKYVFGILGILATWGISTAVYLLFGVEAFREILILAVTMLLTILAAEMIMIPIQLKFGGDKGRIVLIVLVMACVLLGFILKGCIQRGTETEVLFYKIVEVAASVSGWWYLFAAILFLVIETFVSYKISVCMIEKQEY